MIKNTKPVMLIFAVAALLGAALHFLYHLLPILPFAVLAPVDESLFQHLKLLYWPVLLAALVLKKKEGQSVRPRLLGLLLSRLFHVQLDGWLGLLVAALILRAGWEAARDTLDPLLGTPPDPAMVADIKALLLDQPQILGVHDLIVHDYGPGRRMMSVHAEVPAGGSLVELHEVIDRAERELERLQNA